MAGFRTLIACLWLCVMTAPAWAAVPAGLLAEWNFDEGKGDIAHDSSGNGHDAKIHGATRVKQADGFALSLDGFDDHVDCGESRALGIGGPVTLEFWIKPTRRAYGEASVLGESMGSHLTTYYGDHCYWYIGGGDNNVSGKLKLNAWNHVVGTFGDDRLSMWINGQRTRSRESKYKTHAPSGFFKMGIKGRPDLPKFKGMLDRVRVYSRALSGEEILSHVKAEIGSYRDPTWERRVKVAPHYYLDSGEIVVEADYKRLQPLEGKGRLEVSLSNKNRPKEIILRKLVDEVSKAGVEEVRLLRGDLATGDYVIRVTLQDDGDPYPVEQCAFSYPAKPAPLVSPAERVAPALPPHRKPSPFGFKVGKGGGFEVTVKDTSYSFQSRISWPNGDFNRLTAADEPSGKGEKSWKVSVRTAGKDRYSVEAGGDFYTIHRDIGVFPTHVYVKDTYTNTTDEDLGLLIYNEMPIRPEQVTNSLLSGFEKFGRQADITDKGPTVFVTDANTGMGIIPIDDVYVVQAMTYVGWEDAAGVGTEKFALAPGKSYTLEWAVYPTGSGDYYDFVNAFRRVEGRISAIDGGLGFITHNPGSRRQVPTRDFIEKLGLKYGFIHCLATCADDPELSLEGIEFMDFPKEMALLKAQAAAIHKMHPEFKVVFHIAHSLYTTNNPDRFADSKVIGADGKQAQWKPGDYFSNRRLDEGWSWWVFYPTPGNSFHDAMMKSVDVMMDELGFDGGFMDGFFVGYGGRWTYDGRWDGHSAEIDPETKTIKRKIGSVLLLSQPSMIEYARKIRDKGGVVIANNSVITRSIANEKYIIHDAESGAGPYLHLAPNMTGLTWGGGTEKDAYLYTLKTLSWGQLSVPYHIPRTIGHDLTRPLMSSKQFPMTFEEIRSGLVRGKERIVTMNSGVYGWAGDWQLHMVHKFDGRGVQVPHDFITTVDGAGVRTELKFRKDESAVIEPILAVLEAGGPANVRILRYDDVASELLVNGQGEGMLRMFVGAGYFPPGDAYQVTVGGTTTTIMEKDGTLSVPLKLDGQVEVAIEKAADDSRAAK